MTHQCQRNKTPVEKNPPRVKKKIVGGNGPSKILSKNKRKKKIEKKWPLIVCTSASDSLHLSHLFR